MSGIINFCDICENMLYMKIDPVEPGKKQTLYYFCKNCNNEQKKPEN